MKLDGKRLLICEEALIGFMAHYYSWIKSIRKLNMNAGVQVEIAANQKVEDSIADEFSVHRTYSENNWSGIYNHPQAWKRYLGVFKHNRLVYKETKKLFSETEPFDCILLPAARIHHLIAWRFLCRRYLKKHFKRIVIFVLTSEAIYNEDHSEYTFKRSTKLIRFVLRSFRKYVESGEVLFAGDSHITCEEYERLSEIPFTVFPSPGVALAKAPDSSETVSPESSPGPVFVILGLSIYDKGIDLWQEAVLRYLKEYPDGNAKFIIQWGAPTISYDGVEIPIDDKLKNSPKVTLLERSLSDEEYSLYFQQSDFLALPYRRKTYFNRISGVLIEAACSGIPMIVTENTWLSWAMNEYGAGITVKNEDAADLYQKLLYSINHWKELTMAAEAKRPVALEKNSTERYLNCMWEAGKNETSNT
jgi:glycosyltransferase involved in cell wall biosynthesis